MKNKTLASLGTAIVFCLLFLVALPSIASASEDEILDIYGNANEDDIIDMRDLTFTARMILRLEDETNLADANYDGRISVADMTQIGLIILGRESKLTLVDSADRIVTVNKPVERIVTTHITTAEAISLLGAWDRVVGRDYYMTDEILLPGVGELPLVTGIMGAYDVDFEKVFELDPDIFLTLYLPANPGLEDIIDTLEPEGIPVVTLSFEHPATLVENIRKLRYVLNTEERGEEFIAFYEGVVNDITEKTAGLSDDEKPRVFLWILGYDYTEKYQAIAGDWTGIQSQFEIVGGINIAEDLTGWYPEVSEEWLLDQSEDPGIDIIACWVSPWVVPGIFGYEVTEPTVAQDTRNWIMDADENPVLAGSDAVQNERVYLYQTALAASPRFVVGMAYWAKWFHPELFGDDFDPHEIHMTYLTDYMDVDRSEVEDSILFWPEP
jgi:iron complex transport system substrate-binding protein